MPVKELDPVAFLDHRFYGRGLFEEIWQLPATFLEEVRHHALGRGLTAALESPFARGRVGLTPEQACRDPLAAVLRFPPLEKENYWHDAEDLRLADYDELVEHRFHTSGTETGVPTEMPWDDWTYDKSFCESSALALVAAGARSGDLVVIGSPGFGALGLSYLRACERLGLEAWHDELSFNDPTVAAAAVAHLRRAGGGVVVGAPGTLVHIFESMLDAGIDPCELGIRGLISGVGTFLSRRHLDFLIEHVDPERIVEQGGKNEILHAPGALRYRRDRPQAICQEGFLHYAPWVSHVVAVDADAIRGGELVPIGHGRRGVLLMTRLSSGRPGIVAYVNDAGDFGETRGIARESSSLCGCGSALPAFRYRGRVRDSVNNKLGWTIFPEEMLLALQDACRSAEVPIDIAARLRLQTVLVVDPDWRQADTFYWLIGAEPADYSAHPATLEGARDAFLSCWSTASEMEPYDAYMRYGGGAVIDRAGLPHSGRDKARYRLVIEAQATGGENHLDTLRRHVEEELTSRFLGDLP